MFLRMLRQLFVTTKREKVLIILIVAFGATLASVLLNLALNVGDKMTQELSSYGSNLEISPKLNALPTEMDGVVQNPLASANFLNESDLDKLNTIFWANNILAFAPELDTTATIQNSKNEIPLVGTWFNQAVTMSGGEKLTTGLEKIKTWWTIKGEWPSEEKNSDEVLLGKQIANQLHLQPNDSFLLSVNTNHGVKPVTFRVSGIAATGDDEDNEIFAPLQLIQKISNLPGKVSSATVSALTVPDTQLAQKVGTDPSSLREKDFDTWYCTAYTGAIAYQIEEAIPTAEVKPIRQISQSQGTILNKVQFMMVIISLITILTSALAIAVLMSSKVRERAREIALMKVLGATTQSVTFLFLSEAMISGLLGGVLGYGIGIIIAELAGQSVFGTNLEIRIIGLPIILVLSAGIAAAGSFPAIQKIMKLEPIQALQDR